MYMRIELCTVLVLLGASLVTISAKSEPTRLGRPDLTLYSADVDPLNIGPGVMTYPDYYDPADYRDQVTTMDFSDDVPNEGDLVRINLTVFNIGLSSGSGQVIFYDGPMETGEFIGSDNVTVNALNYDTATTIWSTFGIKSEDHEIFAYIDPDDPSNETNDQNNAGSQEILVNFYPYAEITSFSGPDLDIVEGDEILFEGVRLSRRMKEQPREAQAMHNEGFSSWPHYFCFRDSISRVFNHSMVFSNPFSKLVFGFHPSSRRALSMLNLKREPRFFTV